MQLDLAGVLILLGQVVVVIVIFLWLWTTIVITRTKTSKIIETFGKFARATKPGLSFILPWPIQQEVYTVSLQVRELQVEVTVKTSDNAFLVVPVKVQMRVSPGKERDAFYELEDPDDQITSYVVNIVRGKATEMTMDQLFQSKDEFEKAVEEALNAKFSEYGYEMKNILVDDPQPSRELRQAFDKVIASLREKEAAQNIADAIKIKMVGEASAEAESLVLKAKAFKEQRQILGEGVRAAIEEVGNLEGVNKDRILQYFEGIDMRDAIRDAANKPGNVVLIPAKMDHGSQAVEIAAVVKALEESKEQA